MSMRVTWTTLKTFVDAGLGLLRYIQGDTAYYIGVFDNSFIVECEIPRDGGSDVTDFETNYKNTAGSITTTRNKCLRISGNHTTAVKSTAGTLHSIVIGNNSTGGTVTVYDNTAASGTVICVLTMGTPSGGLLSTTGTPGPNTVCGLDIGFNTGLTVVTAGSNSNDITVVYR